MKIFLLAAALMAAGTAGAQTNRISLNVQTLAGGHAVSGGPNEPYQLKSNNISLLPAVGYHRVLKGNTWIGLEAGYNRGRMKSENRMLVSTAGDRTVYQAATSSFDEFYAAPGIFQVISFSGNKYRIIPALSLPLNYIPELRSKTEEWVENSNQDLLSTTLRESAPQQVLRIGLFAGADAQIRVAGGFYAGLHLGAGVTYSRQTAFGESTYRYTPVGRTPTESSTPAGNNLTQAYSFGFQPRIALNYFF